jgi:hypothetical protein
VTFAVTWLPNAVTDRRCVVRFARFCRLRSWASLLNPPALLLIQRAVATLEWLSQLVLWKCDEAFPPYMLELAAEAQGEKVQIPFGPGRARQFKGRTKRPIVEGRVQRDRPNTGESGAGHGASRIENIC